MEAAFAGHGYQLHLMKDEGLPVEGRFAKDDLALAPFTPANSNIVFSKDDGNTSDKTYIEPFWLDHVGGEYAGEGVCAAGAGGLHFVAFRENLHHGTHLLALE
jgi:hypothetical protein